MSERQRKALMKALLDRADQYESFDKSCMIADILVLLDDKSLESIASQQGVAIMDTI